MAQLKKVELLDYQAPASAVRVEGRTKAAELFGQSCTVEADVSACVWAVSLSASLPVVAETDYARIRASTDVLVPMCVAKNNDACRLFDGQVARSPASYPNSDAACGRGLASACDATSRANTNDGIVAPRTPADTLRLENKACDLGDPHGCEVAHRDLVDAKAPAPQIEQLLVKQQKAAAARCDRGYATSCSVIAKNSKRTEAAATDGCTRGYLDECELPVDDAAVSDRLLARACSLTGRGCSSLADSRTDPAKKRDALEHACQFFTVDECVKLVKGYRSKAYPEPVPARADAIVAYLCTPGPNLPGDVCSQVKQ